MFSLNKPIDILTRVIGSSTRFRISRLFVGIAILNKKKIVMFGSNLTSGSGDVF